MIVVQVPRRRAIAAVLTGVLLSLSFVTASSAARATAVNRTGVTAAAAPLPLGTLTTTTATDPSCPAGFSCQGIRVACPGDAGTLNGFLATAEPTRAPRGLAVFFRGGNGGEWVIGNNTPADFLTSLRSGGLKVVQVRWAGSWLKAPAGVRAGTAHLACHPATAVSWIHANLYLPLNVPAPAAGVCGFCVTGNSGGASQSSYALSHYGLDRLMQAAIPTGGPPHSALHKACLNKPEEQQYQYPPDTRDFIDNGWGYYNNTGPCYRQDESFYSQWYAESVSGGGNDYYHPSTRVHFILGERDQPMHPQADDYRNRLQAAGSPRLIRQVVPGMSHSIMQSADGRAALRDALLSTSL